MAAEIAEAVNAFVITEQHEVMCKDSDLQGLFSKLISYTGYIPIVYKHRVTPTKAGQHTIM